ncbi:unnamed protein product [Didymodactylos carnosus]|uniref:TRAF1-6 MATH domain-containing protein n=1 Tax=Didymodactylos carnosus TaxID=1234261 RepID=A0A815JIS2_9BILA|nr:unnamed protein product [Didymodactylos carnosus]CAF1581834.1 unnamed protein product [Didymodactylos carnosus]CAF4268617.1 unnamed protein product [Didymodactylos carnosus]CAF4381669.1 unnamed protein product [Didymodactylos carnosus]
MASLFLNSLGENTLTRREYVAILQWPFTYEVTFCLLDQSEKHKHVIESFRTDPGSDIAELLNNGMDYQREELIFLPPTLTVEQDRNPVQHRANTFWFADQPPFT